MTCPAWKPRQGSLLTDTAKHRQRKNKLKDSNNKNDMSVSQNCFGPFSTHFRCFMFIYFAAYRQIVSEVSVI